MLKLYCTIPEMQSFMMLRSCPRTC
ncbi:hypothetical protein KQP72_06000 [Bacteroides thetaiotaomicron]|nr:hypothetical protein KQP72_06000 [Bacteroides thetaiotaomicron]